MLFFSFVLLCFPLMYLVYHARHPVSIVLCRFIRCTNGSSLSVRFSHESVIDILCRSAKSVRRKSVSCAAAQNWAITAPAKAFRLSAVQARYRSVGSNVLSAPSRKKQPLPECSAYQSERLCSPGHPAMPGSSKARTIR